MNRIRSNTSDGSLERALRNIEEIAGARAAKLPRKRRRFFWLLLAALLPFPVLLRLGTWLYAETSWAVMICVLAAGLASAAGFVVPMLLLLRRRGVGLRRFLIRGTAFFVLAYLGYALTYVSPARFKQPETSQTYRALHPLLRLSLSGLVLVDGNLVITDTVREVEDYDRMGLPRFDRSLHIPQRDGWVHAVDLRTRDRSRSAVWLLQVYFRLSGFRSLRRVGTADHLHVYLPVPAGRR